MVFGILLVGCMLFAAAIVIGAGIMSD